MVLRSTIIDEFQAHDKGNRDCGSGCFQIISLTYTNRYQVLRIRKYNNEERLRERERARSQKNKNSAERERELPKKTERRELDYIGSGALAVIYCSGQHFNAAL